MDGEREGPMEWRYVGEPCATLEECPTYYDGCNCTVGQFRFSFAVHVAAIDALMGVGTGELTPEVAIARIRSVSEDRQLAKQLHADLSRPSALATLTRERDEARAARDAAVRALEAADVLLATVFPLFLVVGGVCRACGQDLIGGHAFRCWLKPMMKRVRETFDAAGVPKHEPAALPPPTPPASEPGR